jgi:ethanolamine utilization protein EutQ
MKQLISAETIRQEHAAGKRKLDVALPNTIVTAEARSVAEQLGVALVEVVAATTPGKASSAAASPCAQAQAAAGKPSAAEIAAIRAAIIARLPPDCVSGEVIDQLIRKSIDERPCDTASNARQADRNGGGIKHVQGGSVQFGRFEGAGEGTQVGLADVITSSDRSPMAAGYMAWSNCFFPWTLGYDEIDVVLEGELHIRSEGKTVIGKAGDVIFIPRGSSIEFGTPGKVRFIYVTYPADWQSA